MDFGMLGPALALALGMVGSAIGCGIGGMALHGVISRVDENHGKLVLMSAMPSSQAIYAFILMIVMKLKIVDKTLDPTEAVGIGLCAGVAIMIPAIYQGMCAASGIQSTAKQPSTFGKCFATLGIVESFSLFAFVFTLMLI